MFSSSFFFALFLVVVKTFYQAQPSNFSHIFVIRTEPDPSYKITHKCDALRDLVPFVQFKKREKHLWKSVNLKLLLLVFITQVIRKKS